MGCVFIYSKLVPNNPAKDYQLETASIDSIIETVSETGNVTTAGTTPIYSTTTGIIEEVFVKNGDIVSEDQVLFKVKSTANKQTQEAALASYLTAKNTLETAKATQLSLQADMFGQWDSFRELAEGDEYENDDGTPKHNQRTLPEFHIPEKDWLAAEANYKKQQQVINQAQVNLSASWRAYQSTQDSEVTALLAGEVINLSVTKGDLVKVASSTLSIDPALILKDNQVKPTIKLQVNETDALKIKEGQAAEVEFDAISKQTFTAYVDRVDTLAETLTDVVTFSIYVVINQDTDLIRSGLTADVDITVSSKDNILTVPSSSVKPYQGGKSRTSTL